MPSSVQSRRISVVPAAWAGGTISNAASRARKTVLRIGRFTLAALGRRERARHRLRPRVLGVGLDGRFGVRGEAAAEGFVAAQAQQGRAQGGDIARGDDQARALVLHEAACGGSYGIGGDHGNSLVEGFVDDEAPRLEKVARGERRHDYNVAARVEVPEI